MTSICEGKELGRNSLNPPLDRIPSLVDYFRDDAGKADELRKDPDWLRDKANAILSDRAGNPRCLFVFAKDWLGERLLFGPAAKILTLALSKVRGEPDLFSNQLRQQLAVATYKNEEAPARPRLEQALSILAELGPVKESTASTRDAVLDDQAETAALNGAVYRRIWNLDGKPESLHAALRYYRDSHGFDKQRDDDHFTGYGALNAAFLLDSLAFRLKAFGDGPIVDSAAQLARKESAQLRGEIVRRLGTRIARSDVVQDEWVYETIAGAYLALGLAQWSRESAAGGPIDCEPSARTLLDEAKRWTEMAVQKAVADWKRETTHAQWLRVGYLNEPPAARRPVLEAYWNAAAEVINPFRVRCRGMALCGWEMAGNARRGKVGLALSGGGFRASFYQLGVLARLAEVDALRHVDVMSTVSGGSIVGAHYYLLLRKLLGQESAPTREAYLDLVERLIAQFSAGVDHNLRVRGLSNLWVTLKLLIAPNYTRSNRMAELYDQELFARTEDGKRKTFPMSSLTIKPPGEDASFNPRYANWRRAARVPALLINATALNTGHSWHFTANWMGEPPELIGDKVDKNERLRRVPYTKARGYESLSLGFAVAASACVPGIFEPLRLPQLYPGRLVRLVDGGVHDNQGVDALLGQGCDFILCSDGSGQMGDLDNPSNGPVGALQRAMDILMKRVREGEHADVDNRVRIGNRRGLLFVHLKSDLPIDVVDWWRCDDPTPREDRKTTTGYGVDRQVQMYLSEIRTDLDSFSEVESSALMTSGYLMTARQLEQLNAGEAADGCPWGGLDVTAPTEWKRWRFLSLASQMAVSSDVNDVVHKDLEKQLRVGRDLFLKHVKLMPGYTAFLTLVVLALVAGVGWLVSRELDGFLQWIRDHTLLLPYTLITVVVAIATGLVVVLSVVRAARVWCVESFFALAGALTSNIFFVLGLNRYFLERGKVKRLLDLR